MINIIERPLVWKEPLWSFGSWIYNYLCNCCLSPPTLWIWIPLNCNNSPNDL